MKQQRFTQEAGFNINIVECKGTKKLQYYYKKLVLI